MRAMDRLIRLLPLSLLMFGLGCDDGIATTESANITLNPANQITFNRVGEGQTEGRQLRIQHSGDIPFNVTGMYISVPGADEPTECDLVNHGLAPGDQLPAAMQECSFFIETRPEWPRTLDESQFIDIDIRYRQVGPDAPTDMEVVVLHDIISLRKEPKRVRLAVQSGQPQLKINRTALAFPPGVPGNDLVTFNNLGNAPLRIERVYMRHISGTVVDPQTGESRAPFRFQTPPDAPWDLDQNQSEHVTIVYEPEGGSDEPAVSELVVESNDYTNGHCVSEPDTPCNSAAQCPSGDRCIGEQSIRVTAEEVQGLLEIEPDPVIFGIVQAPNMVEKSVNISNTGLRFVDVLSITIEQPGDEYAIGDGQTSFRLQGASARPILLRYQPNTVEGSDAVLVIDTGTDMPADNAGPDGKFRVNLVRSGDTLPPDMTLDPLVLDFSAAAPGEGLPLTATVNNPGGAPLTITRIALSTPEDSAVLPTDPEFAITAGGDPLTLPAGGSHEIEITFTRPADSAAVFAGTLIVESAEAGQRTLSLAAQPQ